MKITGSRQVEGFMAWLYDESEPRDFCLADGITARFTVREYLRIIRYVDAFLGTTHLKNVTELYFCADNLTHCTVEDIADRLYMTPRTLAYCREKYAALMRELFGLLGVATEVYR